MFFKLPNEETQSYLELQGIAIAKQEIIDWVGKGMLNSFVKDMKVTFLIRSAIADKMYIALRTGECELGLKDIQIYRIVPPIQVDDVEGKTQISFTANIEYIDNENKKKANPIDIEC